MASPQSWPFFLLTAYMPSMLNEICNRPTATDAAGEKGKIWPTTQTTTTTTAANSQTQEDAAHYAPAAAATRATCLALPAMPQTA